MVRVILKRTHVLENHIKGYMTIEGTNFSCYTLEAKDITGHHPHNPIFTYALPKGKYRLVIGPYKIYPLTPFIKHRPYINISFTDSDDGRVRPGCVAIGSCFLSGRTLVGSNKVFDALEDVIKANFSEWKSGAELVIEDDGDIQHAGDESAEDDGDVEESINFANL